MASGHENLDGLLVNSSEVGIDRELSANLRDFIEIGWHLVEPARPYIDNWHIGAVCEHLEAVINGEIKRLVINEPPGCMKSLNVSVFFPVWSWIKQASLRFIFAAYADTVAKRDAIKSKGIIESDWYKERWPHIKKSNEWTNLYYKNSEGGFRKSVTVKGSITGEHADIQCVDDPIKPLEISGKLDTTAANLDAVIDWWNVTMSSRLMDFENSARIIIMQRLHERDLAGAAMENAGYEHLMLPMRYESERKCHTSIGFEDPRTEEGELLFPQRFPESAVQVIEKELGRIQAEAQLQQNPLPGTGIIFLISYCKYYRTLPIFDEIIQSWDCTFKKTKAGSFVVGQVWGVSGGDYYLLDEVRDRMAFSGTIQAVKRMTLKHPRAHAKLIEDKANGSAVVDHLKDEITGLKLVEPEGGKEARANAVEPLWEAGQVYLPDKTIAPWIEDWVAEVTGFPARAHDDRVDTMTQALTYLRNRSINKLRRAMKAVS